MTFTVDDLRTLTDAAISAANDAGAMVARARPQEVDFKPDGHSLASQVVTEVDRQSEAIIVEHLAPTLERFDLGLLAEEAGDDRSRLATEAFWCIDPLDGTLPFVEGIAGSAVSIALVAHDGQPLVGVVYDIATSTLWHAFDGGGLFRDGERWSMPAGPESAALSVFADRSFVEAPDHPSVQTELEQLAVELGFGPVSLRSGAGAVMNAIGVLTDPPACYVKFPAARGGGSLWDFAATACLFHEAGAVATDVHGEALDLNRTDSTFMNHRGVLFATDVRVAARLRRLAPASPGREAGPNAQRLNT